MMMAIVGRVIAACVALALLLVTAGAVEPAVAAPNQPAAKVKCHWVKATKKRKRHRVCVKVKVKAKSKSKATKKPAVSTTVAPEAGAPAATTPTVLPVADPAPVLPVPGVGAPATGPAVEPIVFAAARLQATTREFSITLSRPAVAAGTAIVQLVNAGQDAHDLHVRPAAGGADVLAIGAVDPQVGDTVASGSATLAAGTYTLYCSLPGHEQAGMHATLTVN
jgi:plastocyanin